MFDVCGSANHTSAARLTRLSYSYVSKIVIIIRERVLKPNTSNESGIAPSHISILC